jgi:hypothetical protein
LGLGQRCAVGKTTKRKYCFFEKKKQKFLPVKFWSFFNLPEIARSALRMSTILRSG